MVLPAAVCAWCAMIWFFDDISFVRFAQANETWKVQ